MDFNFRAPHGRPPPTDIPRTPPNLSFFDDRRPFQGGRGEMIRNPVYTREALRRELEKEQIRENIIMGEIMWRREWEAQVRREMMEREFTFGRAAEGFAILPPAPLPLAAASTMQCDNDGKLLEGTPAFPIGQEVIAGLTLSTFGRNSEAHTPEVKVDSEAVKEQVVSLAGSGTTLSGAMFKSVTPPVTTPGKAPAAGSMEKHNIKSKWICALCRVSASSEKDLNAHLQGKRHDVQARLGTGLSGAKRKSVTPPVTTPGEVPAAGSTKKLSTENKWSCALCRVRASSASNLDAHLRGRRHELKERSKWSGALRQVNASSEENLNAHMHRWRVTSLRRNCSPKSHDRIRRRVKDMGSHS